MDKFGGEQSNRQEATLHLRIAEELRRQIRAGELRAGDQLPSEHALTGQFGVSRGTVRQALQALRATGLVSGSQGRRPRVGAPPLTQPLDQLISFSFWVESMGKRASGRVVSFNHRAPIADEATALAVPADREVYHLVRVRAIDDEPLLLERTTFPYEIGRLLEGVDLATHSIYAQLSRHGIAVASARQLIGAIAATKEDASLLGVSVRTPLLRARRRAFTADGTPLETADDRYLGDRINFALEHSAATAGVARKLD
jgi:GntR family transcriptional regulator